MSHFFLFTLIIIFNSLAPAMNMAEVWGQSATGSFFNGDRKSAAISLGIGTYQNTFQVNSLYSLQTTNNNFSQIGVSLNKAVFQINLPSSEANETYTKKIDSKIIFYSLAYAFSENFSLEGNYRSRNGFYLQGDQKTTGNTTIYKLPNLRISQVGLIGTYTFEKDHKSFLVDPVLYEKRDDSSSWIIISKLNHMNFSSLEDLALLTNLKSNADITSAEVDLLETSIAYSKNAFWEHWFLGGAFGLGLNVNRVKTRMISTPDTVDVKMAATVQLTGSVGYIWTSFKTGLYVNLSNTRINVRNYEFGDTSGMAGYYVGYQF